MLLPGKSYALALKMPGETSTIGVTGLFRAPYADRWKLAFDARKSAVPPQEGQTHHRLLVVTGFFAEHKGWILE